MKFYIKLSNGTVTTDDGVKVKVLNITSIEYADLVMFNDFMDAQELSDTIRVIHSTSIVNRAKTISNERPNILLLNIANIMCYVCNDGDECVAH